MVHRPLRMRGLNIVPITLRLIPFLTQKVRDTSGYCTGFLTSYTKRSMKFLVLM